MATKKSSHGPSAKKSSKKAPVPYVVRPHKPSSKKAPADKPVPYVVRKPSKKK